MNNPLHLQVFDSFFLNKYLAKMIFVGVDTDQDMLDAVGEAKHDDFVACCYSY